MKMYAKNPSEYLTRVSVLDRFQNGSATAKDEEYFFKKYVSLVAKFGYSRGLTEEDVEEKLIGSVFEKLFKRFEQCSRGEREEIIYNRKHGTRGKFRSFVNKVIDVTVKDIWREKNAQKPELADPSVLEAVYAPEEDDDIMHTWQQFILHEALMDLREEISSTHYHIFVKVKLHGKKGPEMAERFQLSVDNVNQICSRTQKKLLAIVKELSEEHPIEKMADAEMCRYIDQTDKEFQALDDKLCI